MSDSSIVSPPRADLTAAAGLTAALRHSLACQAPFLGAAALLIVAGLAAAARWSPVEVPSPALLYLYGAKPFLLQLAVLALVWPLLSLLIHRPARPIRHLAEGARRHLRPPSLLWSLPILLACPLIFATFSEFKTALPSIRPFAYDALFARLDAAIHFGLDPWVVTHALFGSPSATIVIQFFYLLWLFAFSATFLWQILDLRRPELRLRFLLTFIVCWSLLGMLAAVLLSSAGPIFYAEIVGTDRFAALTERLAAVRETPPLQTLLIRDELWSAYEDPSADSLIRGISAMPSMHVSMAVLMALLGWHYGRVAGWAGTLFAVMIMIGSVHLAWHYAIDGYLAAIATLVIWWINGRFAALWHGRMAPRDIDLTY